MGAVPGGCRIPDLPKTNPEQQRGASDQQISVSFSPLWDTSKDN
jgi:hypothetical protein